MDRILFWSAPIQFFHYSIRYQRRVDFIRSDVIAIVAMPAIRPVLTHFIVAGVTSLSSTTSI
jgi:hypothetical protein